MAPQPGARVTESIELVSPLGEGAMGKVWVAYHHRLRTRVAVKFVSDRVTEEDAAEVLARFEHEASMAAQIKSPHVVQTYDSGLSLDGTPYIVMELLEGQSLGERLRGVGPFGWHEAATVITQVARALTKAHELGIVHRDIKPDNIFLTRGEDGALMCKVLDFGIAKQTRLPAMGGLTTDGKLVGTPEYISPELVLEDRAVDYRADLWALAVVMYTTLTGALPYAGKTLGQLCLNLVSSPFLPASHHKKDLPPLADAWFMRALAFDPAQRFGSAREMAVAFAEVTVGGASLVTATLLGGLRSDGSTMAQFGTAKDAPLGPTAARTARRVKAAAGAVLLLGVLGTAYAVVVDRGAGSRANDGTPNAAAAGTREAPGLEGKRELREAGGDDAAAAAESASATPGSTGSGSTTLGSTGAGSTTLGSTGAGSTTLGSTGSGSPAQAAGGDLPGAREKGTEAGGKTREAASPKPPPPGSRRGKDELGF